MTPSLREDRIVGFLGFTPDDLNRMPQPLQEQPKPIYDLLLKNDLFIRTSSVAEVIKQFIIPKKAVRFRDAVIQHDISPNRRNSNANRNAELNGAENGSLGREDVHLGRAGNANPGRAANRSSPYDPPERRSSARIATRRTRSKSIS